VTRSLTLDRVTKLYDLGADKKRAVVDVSFVVNEGERVGIIGRNGAGKTTLLRMIAGVAQPSSGTIRAVGRVTALLTLGIGLREDLTGMENIRIDGELLGRSDAETAAVTPSVVEFADLGEFIDLPVRTYSTGMKARLAFSMLVHIEPEILIIDEALSVGDARFSSKATAKMAELTRRGRIVLFVSHSMASIVDICTRCIWMDDGKIRMDGAPDVVTNAYLNEVRAADDERLLRRFRNRLIDERSPDGWALSEVGLRDSQGQLSIAQTAEPLAIQAEIAGPPESWFGATLDIDRLDGVRVCSSEASGFHTGSEGTAVVRADLGLLPLSQGMFSAIVGLHVSDRRVARRSILFEVTNARPHRGGRPILTLPTDLRIEDGS
jgi:lipopolysaccharide transport system ATP-binding protein